MDWPSTLDEYEKLVTLMNTPRVVIDNTVCATATVVKVDSVRKDGILLEAVQVLTDLDLSIQKAYISSDGRWFMDVFHVTDSYGQKITDDRIISYMETSLAAVGDEAAPASPDPKTFTILELVGSDRPGLLSDVFAVLTDLGCVVMEAKLWTHKGRIAALLFIREEDSAKPIDDSDKIRRIETLLCNVVRGATTVLSSSSVAVAAGTQADRRLHQMMYSDQADERGFSPGEPSISIQNWDQRGYSIVNVHCCDRPKLLFDVVCTLTDMDYIVFHGTIDTTNDRAYQEFYIRHSDGSPITTETERQRVIHCLQAAIERRASEGLRLELCEVDPIILTVATRSFRENGLSVTRAEMSTNGGTSVNFFYVTDAGGHPAKRNSIEAVIERIGASSLKAFEDRSLRRPGSGRGDPEETGGVLMSLGSLVKRNLYNLGLIRSCSVKNAV